MIKFLMGMITGSFITIIYMCLINLIDEIDNLQIFDEPVIELVENKKEEIIYEEQLY